MTHFVYINTKKMTGLKRKRQFFEQKSWNNFYFSAKSTFQESVSKQNFNACARAKHSAVIPSNVKSP